MFRRWLELLFFALLMPALATGCASASNPERNPSFWMAVWHGEPNATGYLVNTNGRFFTRTATNGTGWFPWPPVGTVLTVQATNATQISQPSNAITF